MSQEDCPHFFLVEDRRLCSTGQHCPGFPQVLCDALLHLGYDGELPIYRCRSSMPNGLDICETRVTIPFDQKDLWMGTLIINEPDTTVEQTAHVALTSLCESHLTATAIMLIMLFLIRNHENPMWKQRLEAMSDLEGHQFSTSMAVMAKYAQYLFNL
jgi:hypothetical protein